MNAKELGAQLAFSLVFPDGSFDPGLTKRELFAAMAMSAWIQALGQRHAETGYTDEGANAYAARYGAQAADALLAELSKDQP